MKKHLYILATALLSGMLWAQDASDAIRFSQNDLNGTARYRAMSGAFGALGGDLSAINANPAGSAIYNNNEIGFTLSNQHSKNSSNYFGTMTETTNNSFDFNQFGSVWVFKNYNPNDDWTKIALAINYQNDKNFDDYYYSAGFNPTNSIANYFISYANGIPFNTLDNANFLNLNFRGQQAFLGYNGYIIDPAPNDQYVSRLDSKGNFYQDNFTHTYGYNSRVAFNLASSYQNRFYFGANLNWHFTDFRKNTSFYEDYRNSPGHNPNSGVQWSQFDNYLHTYGSGFSFQLGTIAKITNDFRAGFTVDSPIWYQLYDDQLQNYTVNCPDCDQNTGTFYVDPNTTIFYPRYTVRTPWTFTPSLAYIIQKKGLISFDYSFKDYSTVLLKPENEFSADNNEIRKTLTFANTFRVGGEYKIQQLSLRGGYRYEESPYKNDQTIGILRSWSTGFGYNFGPAKFDFAYTFITRDHQQPFFSQGLTDPAYIKSKFNNIAFTLLFPF